MNGNKIMKLIGTVFVCTGGILGIGMGIVFGIGGLILGVVLCFAIAVIFISIGSVLLAIVKKQNDKIKKLRAGGIIVNGQIVDIAVNNSMTVNGVNPIYFIVEVRGADGILRRYNSDSTMKYVSRDIIGMSVPVLVAPDDPECYYVDLKAVNLD